MRNFLSAAVIACALAGCASEQSASRPIVNDRERVCGRWQSIQEKDKVVAKYGTRVLADGNGRPVAVSTDPEADRHLGGYSVIRCYDGYASP